MNYVNFGRSLVKELGLWAGAIVSFLLGGLWCIPLLLQWIVGSPHTGDTLESFLIICVLVVAVCLVATILFIAGAMRNTVSDSQEATVVEYDGGEVERM
jgi:hypothetical protein